MAVCYFFSFIDTDSGANACNRSTDFTPIVMADLEVHIGTLVYDVCLVGKMAADAVRSRPQQGAD